MPKLHNAAAAAVLTMGLMSSPVAAQQLDAGTEAAIVAACGASEAECQAAVDAAIADLAGLSDNAFDVALGQIANAVSAAAPTSSANRGALANVVRTIAPRARTANFRTAISDFATAVETGASDDDVAFASASPG